MVDHVTDESEIERHGDGLVNRSLHDILLSREHRQKRNVDHAHETGDAREAEDTDAVFNSVNGNRQPVADCPNADWISDDEKNNRNDGMDGKSRVEPLSAFFQRIGRLVNSLCADRKGVESAYRRPQYRVEERDEGHQSAHDAEQSVVGMSERHQNPSAREQAAHEREQRAAVGRKRIHGNSAVFSHGLLAGAIVGRRRRMGEMVSEEQEVRD